MRTDTAMRPLAGDSITVIVRENAAVLHSFGGSPIGNSRVKLTNAADLVERGLVDEVWIPCRRRLIG